MPANKQLHLDNRPEGEAKASNFKLVTSETPSLKDAILPVPQRLVAGDSRVPPVLVRRPSPP